MQDFWYPLQDKIMIAQMVTSEFGANLMTNRGYSNEKYVINE